MSYRFDWRDVYCPVNCDFQTKGKYQKFVRAYAESQGLDELPVTTPEQFHEWKSQQVDEGPSPLALLIKNEEAEPVNWEAIYGRPTDAPAAPTARRGNTFGGTQ